MPDDVWTQQQAHIIAFDYNLVPFDPMRCEKILHDDYIRTMFFATKDRRVKIHIQYDREQLIWP